MQFFKSILTIALCTVGIAQAEPIHRRAPDRPIGKLYGYGANITALPLFVADGTAYLGNVSLSTISGASNVTFRYVASDGEIIANHQHTNASGTTTNATENYFAIDTASGASQPVLIESQSATADYTTTDFFTYGTQIVWRDPDATIPGTITASFYAIKSDVEGIWGLYWDADGSAGKKGNVVVLKNVPF